MVLHLEPKGRDAARAIRDPEARLAEAVGLAKAIGLDVVAQHVVPLSAARPATLIGSGKVEEIAAEARALEPEVIVMNAALSPVQQRNLEKAWNAKVLDRTALILEIFGERARTREGRLQVELAHLSYQRSRLVRSWTHLERQRGGFGFLGGPGETQIETDRRLIGEAHRQDPPRTRRRQPHARAASPRPQARALSHRCAGGLHQCRKIHPFQHPHPIRRRSAGHVVCDARSHHARDPSAQRPSDCYVRHRRLHLWICRMNLSLRSAPPSRKCWRPM